MRFIRKGGFINTLIDFLVSEFPIFRFISDIVLCRFGCILSVEDYFPRGYIFTYILQFISYFPCYCAIKFPRKGIIKDTRLLSHNWRY